MGFASGSIGIPRPLAALSIVFSGLKTILKIVVPRLPLPDKSFHQSESERHGCRDPSDRPPAALVPLPPHLVGESIKRRLPMVRISECGVTSEDSASVPLCVVCMDCVDAKEEIRQLSNCRHVFHSEHLDHWIDEGHGTCPLCKSKLLSDYGEADVLSCAGGDPWRMERMVYLFGEDYVMDS